MRLPAVGQNRCASIVERLEVRRMLHAGDVDLLPADLQPYARDDGHVLQSDFLRVRPEFIGMNLWAADTFNPTHSTNPADWLYDPHTIESQMPVDYPAIATSSATTQAVINLPDLVPLTSGPYLQPFIDTTEIPGHTLLRFTTAVGNQGSGPAILTSSNTGTPPAGSGITSWINADGTQNVLQRLYTTSGTSFVFNSYRPAGRMVYHPTHGHFHLDGYARYRLLTKVNGSAGPVALRSNWDNSQAVGDKIGFCVVDFNNTFTLPAGGSSATLPTYSYTGAPVVGCGFLQGLNVGRSDVY